MSADANSSAQRRNPAAAYNSAIGDRNRERVRHYFATHLCATRIECATSLGLNSCVVGRHVKAIRAEWKDETA